MNLRLATIALLILLFVPGMSIAQLPSTLDSYLYLSVIETALYEGGGDDIIWFYNGDTLDGIVRSNDYISIRQRPVFLEHVYSSMEEFRQHSANPYFEYEPYFEVEEFEFEFDMDEIRTEMTLNGNYYPDYYNGVPVITRLEACRRGWLITQYPDGADYNEENIITSSMVEYSDETILFVEGKMEISGNSVQGNNTIVCSGEIRIIDDLVYEGTIASDQVMLPNDCNATLGLIAAGDILIGNTEANGRGNGYYNSEPGDRSKQDCIITASLVSTNGSFAIENKNFAPGSTRYDGYYWCDRNGEHPGEMDRRGTLYFLGSLAHYRRDYTRLVHCGFTGYEKTFRYDHRLEELTPPLFDNTLGIKERSGLSTSLPVTHQLQSAYPNPFNSSFNLNMTLAKRDQVTIRLVNVLGQEVFAQNYGWMNVGDQRFTINLADKPAGLYLAQVTTTGGFNQTQKVIYMK